jgi:UDP-N-acetylglucosamine--N-acetylmuramyl-(pentapeptide) pyrophosphoryl-undecaprenol N-acetylglucosamine transferase
MEKIVLCGGHLTPALALIEELESKKDLKIFFFGRKFSTEGSANLSAEYNVINGKGLSFIPITTGRLQRKLTKYTIPSLLKIPVGLLQSLYYLAKIRPGLVVSFGGYLSVPVVFCAWLLGIDSVTHEQAIVPGLANLINTHFVKKVFLSWPETQKFFPKEKTEVIGNLTRKSLFQKRAPQKRLAQFLQSGKRVVFVTGGNQGSHFLNTLTFQLLPKLSSFAILHQVGTANYQNDYEKSQKIKKKNYLALQYLGPGDIGAAFENAEIIISRSGANTVWDIAMLGKIALFIPLPISASQEQYKNAAVLHKAGSAEILRQNEAAPQKVEQLINDLAKNAQKYRKNAQAFSRTLPKNAAQKIVNYIYKYK